MAFDMPSNHPACSPSVFGHTNNADSSPFGTTSPFGAQTGGSNSSSTGVFVGTQASSTEGSTSVFGASSPPPFDGSSVFGQNPASECPGFTTLPSPFGNPSQESQPTMLAFGTQPLEASNKPAFSIPASASSVTPAFGDSSTPAASGSNSTPAFGSTGSAFGVSNSPFGSTTSAGSSFSFASAPAFDHSPTPFNVTSIPVSPFDAKAHTVTPAFGNHGFSQFNQPSSAQSFPSGASATTLAFGDHGFSQFKRVGSRMYSYAQTPEVGFGTQPDWKLVSISAMSPYKVKTHEELRWEDYQSGDKGDAKPYSSTTPTPTPPFGSPAFASSPHTLNSSTFGPPTFSSTTPTPTPLFGIPAFASSPHTLNSSPFGPPASPSLFSTPNTSNHFGPAQPFGTPTSHPLFGTPSTSGFGTPSSSAVTTQAQGTTSSFANGINPGTQSANLFQSSAPAPGQTSSLFGQPARSPFIQTAPYNLQSAPAFSQSNAFARNMFSSTPSSPSTNNMGWWNPINPFLSSPNQSAQVTQNPAYFVAQTGGTGGFNQNSFEQMFTNFFGALQAMRQLSTTVAGEPAPMRLSCMSSNDASFMMMEFQNLKL